MWNHDLSETVDSYYVEMYCFDFCLVGKSDPQSKN